MTASCRNCEAPLTETFADLGISPVSNAFISPQHLGRGEMFYPLHAKVCGQCFLVQLDSEQQADLHFHEDYVYFSSFSSSWLEHARQYVESVTARFGLGAGSHVIEIASNDGYLLKNFVARQIPCLGIEPTANTAEAARQLGVPTWEKFFGEATARELVAQNLQADLMAANNVFAHVPDIHDFVKGIALALKSSGTMTIEFPHLLRQIEQCQFDTIYHEHYSYYSLLAVENILSRHGLEVFDVEELGTHGGSLRVYLRHRGGANVAAPGAGLAKVRADEAAAGLHRVETYRGFQARVEQLKDGLLAFLLQARRDGKTVVAYGAPAKGNTLLNYCGVKSDLIAYTVDASPHKQHKFLPGTRLPVYAPAKLRETKPDLVLILPWNLSAEITAQHAYIREWGGRFVVAVPRIEVLG